MTSLVLSVVLFTPAKTVMTHVHDLTVKMGFSVKEIMEKVELAHPDLGLKKTQIYKLIKRVKANKDTEDRRGLDSTRPIRTPDVIEAVRVDVEADHRVTVKQLASRHEPSAKTIHQDPNN